jgi:ferredoxin-type protein NapG
MSADRKIPPASAMQAVLKRRQFIFDSAKMVCGVGMLGLGLGLYAKQAKALPPLAIRPPGAIAEADFVGACIRCGMCVRDCPYHILELAKPENPVATGTPFFTARTLPCEMCEDIPCVKACPTGALDHRLTDIAQSRMGLATLVDHETCLNFLGLRCDVCYRVCPLIDKAITLDMLPNTRTGRHAMFLPTVHSDACTGCGKCERACVLEEAAIRVLPPKLAKGELSKTYRIGWEEKKAAGHSLIDESQMLDLPDRMPEGVSLPNHFDPGSSALPATPPAFSGAGAPAGLASPAASPAVPSTPPGLGHVGSSPFVPSTPPGMGGAR